MKASNFSSSGRAEARRSTRRWASRCALRECGLRPCIENTWHAVASMARTLRRRSASPGGASYGGRVHSARSGRWWATWSFARRAGVLPGMCAAPPGRRPRAGRRRVYGNNMAALSFSAMPFGWRGATSECVRPNPALKRTGRYVTSPSVAVDAAGRLA